MKSQTPEWKEYSEKIVQEIHGNVKLYRDLYYGKHGEIFERAKNLITNGELSDNIENGMTRNPKGNIRTPYIIANACKVICKVPATMVSRAIGKMSLSDDQTFSDTLAAAPIEGIDTANPDANVIYLSDVLEEIERMSGFNRGAHFSNILQQQIDGGLVGVPIVDDNGIKIDFKKREVYFPHEDGLGCDLGFTRTLENMKGEMEDFYHIHRQRVEDGSLNTEEILYRLKDTKLEAVEEEEAKKILETKQLTNSFADRNRPFIVYWANEATFDFPLGTSALFGQEGKQDEINWTLTQAGVIFQRNGKPRFGVSKKVMNALRQAALDRYDDETLIDHRDMEIMEFDENNPEAMKIYQIDVTKIGDIKWVKDLMKMMFIETETSEKAVDFYLQEGASAAQSGIAKFYDLFTSIVKAERLVNEYVDFIQELVENCFWLMSKQDEFNTIQVVRPNINVKDVIPTAIKERVETEALAKEKGLRSTERALKNINDRDSQSAIEDEMTAIEEGQQSVNSNSASALSLNSMQSLLDNKAGGATATATAGGGQSGATT